VTWQVAHLFSAYCVRLSIDQKANLKSNSDHNTAEGGNRKKFQISSERTCVHHGVKPAEPVCFALLTSPHITPSRHSPSRAGSLTYSHGAGGDHLAKYGLFSMLLLPVRKEQRGALGLADLDLSSVVSSYQESDAFFERPGLAFVLGHCQSIEPENAFRDAADVAEMIETHPSYFLTPNLDLVPFIIFEKDNSHGVQDVSCRFAFTPSPPCSTEESDEAANASSNLLEVSQDGFDILQSAYIQECTQVLSTVTGTKDRVFPMLQCSLFVRRRHGYIIHNIAYPMGSFAFMAGFQFCVPAAATADRLSVSLTLVLTAAAYKTHISTMTPHIAYSTLIDQYVSLCTAFIAIMATEAATIGRLSADSRLEPATLTKVDEVCLYVSISLFVLIHVWFLYRSFSPRVRSARVLRATVRTNPMSVK
jgi:hypothetical protein